MPPPPTKPRIPWKRIGLVAAVAWVAVLAYFLLVNDPPDLWYNDIAEIEGPGHVLAGVVSALIAYYFLAHRSRPFLTAFGVTIAFLLALELVQDLLSPSNRSGYELSDVALSVIGAAVGIAVAWVARRLFGWPSATE